MRVELPACAVAERLACPETVPERMGYADV
jgi:hypothetical protein